MLSIAMFVRALRVRHRLTWGLCCCRRWSSQCSYLAVTGCQSCDRQWMRWKHFLCLFCGPFVSTVMSSDELTAMRVASETPQSKPRVLCLFNTVLTIRLSAAERHSVESVEWRSDPFTGRSDYALAATSLSYMLCVLRVCYVLYAIRWQHLALDSLLSVWLNSLRIHAKT